MKFLKSLFGIKTRKHVTFTISNRNAHLVKAYMDIGFNVFFDAIRRIWVLSTSVMV